MKKFLAVLAITLFGATALAAEVDPDEYVKQYSTYGSSDGVFQRKDTEGLDVFSGGYRFHSVLKQTFYEDFSEYGDGETGCVQNDWTACSATGTNLVTFPSGNTVGVLAIVGQTVAGGVDMDAASLDISGDQTDNDGLELFWGGIEGAGGAPFFIGESAAFYTCATVTVADVTGVDDFHIGFRRFELANATFDNYLDVASIGPIAGNVTIETILNNGTTTTTDTTNDLADAGSDTYCVYVSAAGVVTYTIDGLEPLTTAAFTFDDADPVIPFIHLLQTSDLSEEIDLTEWEVGFQ